MLIQQTEDAYFRRLTELKLDTAVVGGIVAPSKSRESDKKSQEDASATDKSDTAPAQEEGDGEQGWPHNEDKRVEDYDRLRVRSYYDP